ncbi:hypothetical protein V6N13_098860 [Hibiscus sabdariffa]|uniref:Uncharacterized protein n=1 Tax=Hibiscus sabdariffa TaxID=183260 RepID=A0ABR2EF55_9ROSI
MNLYPNIKIQARQHSNTPPPQSNPPLEKTTYPKPHYESPATVPQLNQKSTTHAAPTAASHEPHIFSPGAFHQTLKLEIEFRHHPSNIAAKPAKNPSSPIPPHVVAHETPPAAHPRHLPGSPATHLQPLP